MPTLMEGVLAKISLAFDPSEDIDVSGNPGAETYPFIVVDNLNFGEVKYNSKRFADGTMPYEQEQNVQVTVAALDPSQAIDIGERAFATLLPSNGSRSRVELSTGYEVNRYPVGGRTWSQEGVGPSSMAVFYYAFDIRLYVGKRA